MSRKRVRHRSRARLASLATLGVCALTGAAGANAPTTPLEPTLDPSVPRSVERAEIGIEWLTTITVEHALSTRDGRAQKTQLSIEPELELSLPGELSLVLAGRLRYDGFDRLEPGGPAQPEVSRFSRRGHFGDHDEYELRELYLERDLGPFFVRAGKQHIVWGKADGLKVLDQVNPQDFREFVLPEFEDSRIPLWALHVEVPIHDVTAQLVWLLDQSYHDLPEPDALYAFTSPQLVPSLAPGPVPATVELKDPRRPRRVVADSDAGLRLSTFQGGWDLTLNYLYHYHDEPVLTRRIDPVPGGIEIEITPRYERVHLLGATFSNAFGPFTLRGELGYTFGRAFTTTAASDLDGARSDELSYVIGLDWSGLSDTWLSVQVFQTHVRSHERSFLIDSVTTRYSVLAQRDFMHQTLHVELEWVHDQNSGDGFLRPKVRYDLRDDVRIWVGADVFYGDEDGLFGQFDTLDRLVLGIEWTL